MSLEQLGEQMALNAIQVDAAGEIFRFESQLEERIAEVLEGIRIFMTDMDFTESSHEGVLEFEPGPSHFNDDDEWIRAEEFGFEADDQFQGLFLHIDADAIWLRQNIS